MRFTLQTTVSEIWEMVEAKVSVPPRSSVHHSA